MKSVFTFLWGSLLACSAAAQTTLSDACVVSFKMDARTSQTCNGGSAPSYNGTSITLLGKRIADGFFWDREPISVGSGRDNLYGKNGSLTPPAGSAFNNCPGNWVYFTASGFTSIGRGDVSRELINIHLRIRAFGNERNPDSLRVEFSQNSPFRTSALFNSAKKTIRCNGCIATDRENPRIFCSNQTVQFPLAANQTTIHSEDIMKFANIKASDDCALNDVRTHPHKLANITHGQIVDYHTVAYDSAGNQSTCRFKVQFLSPTNDTCSVNFSIESRNTPTCDGTANSRIMPGSHSIRLLGKRVADGIQMYRGAGTPGGFTTVLFGKNGSKTPPRGSIFITCSGNWTYFTASARSISERRHENIEYTNIHLRVKNFGNEFNPDSLRIEFSGNASSFGGGFFNTSKKWIDCDKCRAMDKTPPTIQNCPTQIVKYPVANPQYISGDSVAKLAKIKVSDNCALENVSTYPHRVYQVEKGQIVDFHTVAYDGAGNKSVCRFKAKVVVAPCSEFPKPIIGYLSDIEALAAAGQTCKSVTWTPPSIYNESSFNPVKFTSNYPSGHCFPIGVTRVLYTAKDSCGKIDTAGFFVTVRKSNVPDMRVTLHSFQSAYFAGTIARYTIEVQNLSGVAFTNVKIKFPFHPNTISAGKAEPSSGTTWTETCANGVNCYEWVIPNLDANQSAYVKIPLEMLKVIGKFKLNAELVSSTPADTDASNNSATWEMDSGNATARLSADNQQVTLDIKTLSPNPTDGALLMNLKSLVAKEVTFDFYNTVGSKVYSQTQQVQKGENELFFDVTKLPTGVYFIQTSELGEQNATTKFVKN
jgi:Domain of unknown function DUF11/Secretion system C-terminal sorting domain/HYR domain